MVHGDNVADEQSLRDQLCKALGEGYEKSSSYILLNFWISSEDGHFGVGHFSPISCYDQESDMFLILDVWPGKDYSDGVEPFWIKTEKLLEAIKTVDTTSQKSRGFIVLKSLE